MGLNILGEDEANASLEELSGGEWSIVDYFEASGRRYIVATREPNEGSKSRRLTPREVDVVSLVARGHGNKRVAQELGLSASTVAGHIAMAMARWGVASRVSLVARWNLVAGVQPQAAGPQAGQTSLGERSARRRPPAS
jgi:DNA-binding NarL/FixJ family response regulator